VITQVYRDSRSWATLSFWVALAIFLLTGWVTYESIVKYQDASKWRDHTYAVIETLDQLRTGLVDAETGQRGYLITGESDYLEDYRKSLDAIGQRKAELRTLTVDNASQQWRLNTLEPLVTEKLMGLERRIQIRKSQGLDAAAQAIITSKDKRVMNQIRDITDAMNEEEHNLLKQRDQLVARQANRTEVILACAALVCLSLLRIAFEMLKREITEHTNAEIRIQTLNENLEKNVHHLGSLNKELEAFSYSVSHDLRTPLRALDGYSKELLENLGGRLDAQNQSDLNRIRAAAARMGQLIDDLLDLSRLARTELAREDINLGAAADKIVQEFQKARPERQAEFVIAPDLNVKGDPKLLQIVLQNLLENAWKFTEKRPVSKIELGATERDGQRVFFVKDNGAGFDMAYVGKLFGAFQRLHDSDEFPGTGIGLATVQRIINRHGGTIWAEAKVGDGAAFYFTLP